MQKFFLTSDVLKHAKNHSQSSASMEWREVVEGTVHMCETVSFLAFQSM
jgi:hypothetical protein